MKILPVIGGLLVLYLSAVMLATVYLPFIPEYFHCFEAEEQRLCLSKYPNSCKNESGGLQECTVILGECVSHISFFLPLYEAGFFTVLTATARMIDKIICPSL